MTGIGTSLLPSMDSDSWILVVVGLFAVGQGAWQLYRNIDTWDGFTWRTGQGPIARITLGTGVVVAAFVLGLGIANWWWAAVFGAVVLVFVAYRFARYGFTDEPARATADVRGSGDHAPEPETFGDVMAGAVDNAVEGAALEAFGCIIIPIAAVLVLAALAGIGTWIGNL